MVVDAWLMYCRYLKGNMVETVMLVHFSFSR